MKEIAPSVEPYIASCPFCGGEAATNSVLSSHARRRTEAE